MGDHKPAFDPLGGSYPATDLDSLGTVCLTVPKRFIPFMLGALNPYRWPDAWSGADEDINRTTAQVDNFLVDLILRQECSQECPPGETVECPACRRGGGGDFGIFMEDEMPCIDLSSLIKIENGVLYVKDSCCDWVAIGSQFEQAPDLGDTPLDPNGTGTVTYSACGKAWAIVRAIYMVLEGARDALVDWDWPWQILPNIEEHVGYNLDNKWMAALVTDWLAFGGSVTPSDVFSVTDQQISVCSLTKVFGDDPYGVPDNDTYEAVKTALHTRGFFYDGLIMTAVACLGRGNLNTIARLAAADTGQDCNCPDEWTGLDIPTAGGWYLGEKLPDLTVTSDGTYAWFYNCHEVTLVHDVYGMVFEFAIDEGNSFSQMSNSASDCSAITSFWGDSSQPTTWRGFCACGATAVLNELLGTGQYNAMQAGKTWSSTVNSPNHLKDAVIAYTLKAGYHFAGNATLKNARFIHNINSPSHSA